MALTPDNDVPLPGNIQALDRIYPSVISLVSPYNAGDCTRRVMSVLTWSSTFTEMTRSTTPRERREAHKAVILSKILTADHNLRYISVGNSCPTPITNHSFQKSKWQKRGSETERKERKSM